MAKKRSRVVRKPAEPLRKNQQEMSAMQIWLWLIGGLLVLAIIFALLEILAARFFS